MTCIKCSLAFVRLPFSFHVSEGRFMPCFYAISKLSRSVFLLFFSYDHIYVWIYENDAKELKSRPKRAISKLKGKSVLFSFLYLYPFIFLSLPSFVYFSPVVVAWRRPKSLMKSRLNKGVWGRVL